MISPVLVFLLGLNLRPAVTSLGAALPDMGVPGSLAAVLVALPLWACGIGGLLTPWLRGGTRPALAVLAVALVARVVGGPVLLITGTTLACLAIALIGTLLPVLVRGSRVLKACYTLALGCGSTAGALITPWVVERSSWQVGLSGWTLLAAIALFFWRRGVDTPTLGKVRPFALRRSGTAWALTVYFGLVSTVTFLVMGSLPAILRAAGVSADAAGACLSLSMAMGLPMMWLVPLWAHRWRRRVLAIVVIPNILGIAGLLVAPATLPWLWSAGLGIGMGGLALALTCIPMRAGADPAVTGALSAMTQGVGYLIAGVGALVCGLLHGLTHDWRGSLVFVLVVLCGQAVAGLLAVRPVTVRPDSRLEEQAESAAALPESLRQPEVPEPRHGCALSSGVAVQRGLINARHGADHDD
jgi:CP family cyanate transporter-like MFS transporter